MKNKLRPCPVLDNPGALTKLVGESNAKSTDYMARESAGEYSDKRIAVKACGIINSSDYFRQ